MSLMKQGNKCTRNFKNMFILERKITQKSSTVVAQWREEGRKEKERGRKKKERIKKQYKEKKGYNR